MLEYFTRVSSDLKILLKLDNWNNIVVLQPVFFYRTVLNKNTAQ